MINGRVCQTSDILLFFHILGYIGQTISVFQSLEACFELYKTTGVIFLQTFILIVEHDSIATFVSNDHPMIHG